MKSDKVYKVKINVTGFTQAQVEEGLQDLLDEIRQRPWIFEPQAYWENSINQLAVIVGYDLEERLEEGAIDEISDCIIATMHFDEKISFDIQRT